MSQLYDAAERGDFDDPPQRISWMRDETRRLHALTDRQLRAVVRIACAALVARGVEIRNDPDRGADGLGMAIVFAAGLVIGALVTFTIYIGGHA